MRVRIACHDETQRRQLTKNHRLTTKNYNSYLFNLIKYSLNLFRNVNQNYSSTCIVFPKDKHAQEQFTNNNDKTT